MDKIKQNSFIYNKIPQIFSNFEHLSKLNTNTKDEFTKTKKEISKKKIGIITGIISAIVLTTLAIINRKKLGDLSKELIEKVKTKTCKNPQLEIPKPKSGKYDLSKECKIAEFYCNNSQTGFNGLASLTKEGIADKSLVKLPDYCGAEIGITKKGNAFVKADFGINSEKARNLASQAGKEDINKKVLTSINLISDNQNFTQSQIDLLCLLQQEKEFSPNSPIYKATNYDLKTSDDILKLLEKWSQDIDLEDPNTQELLEKIKILKKDQMFFIDNNKEIKLFEKISKLIKS